MIIEEPKCEHVLKRKGYKEQSKSIVRWSLIKASLDRRKKEGQNGWTKGTVGMMVAYAYC